MASPSGNGGTSGCSRECHVSLPQAHFAPPHSEGHEDVSGAAVGRPLATDERLDTPAGRNRASVGAVQPICARDAEGETRDDCHAHQCCRSNGLSARGKHRHVAQLLCASPALHHQRTLLTRRAIEPLGRNQLDAGCRPTLASNLLHARAPLGWHTSERCPMRQRKTALGIGNLERPGVVRRELLDQQPDDGQHSHNSVRSATCGVLPWPATSRVGGRRRPPPGQPPRHRERGGKEHGREDREARDDELPPQCAQRLTERHLE